MARLLASRDHRRGAAAVLAVAGLVVGAVAAIGTPASAADGDLVATRSFSCTTVVGANPNNFTWSDAQITLAASHPVGSNQVTVTAAVSNLPAIAPVKMSNFPGTDQMVLSLGGTPLTLTGSGPITNSGPNQPVPMPPMTGTLTSTSPTFAVTVTSLQLVVSGITTDCNTPTPDGNLGTLTNVEKAAGAVTPTPTTTTSATATPTASASTSPTASASASPTSGSAKGKAAKGDVTFACVLNPLGTKFDYPASVTVSGSRASAKDDLALSATMSDLPGISPVPIDGQMDVTLDLLVAKKKTTLEGGTHAVAAAKAPVKVPTMTGEAAVEGDELAVSVTGFTFNFAALAIDADCTTDAVALSAMKVGSEPVAVDDSDSGSGSGSGSDSGSSSGGLPQTGGGDALPVIALWAIALSLLGAALLLIVPGAVRKKA